MINQLVACFLLHLFEFLSYDFFEVSLFVSHEVLQTFSLNISLDDAEDLLNWIEVRRVGTVVNIREPQKLHLLLGLFAGVDAQSVHEKGELIERAFKS